MHSQYINSFVRVLHTMEFRVTGSGLGIERFIVAYFVKPYVAENDFSRIQLNK